MKPEELVQHHQTLSARVGSGVNTKTRKEKDAGGEGVKIGTNTHTKLHLVHELCSCRVHLDNASAFRTLSLCHVVVDGQVALL